MWNINRDCNPSITIIIFHIMPGVMWNINHESNVLDFGGNVDHLMLGLWLWNGYSHGWYYCLFVGGSVTTITRNWVQTGFVGKGSDHLQLIEFWPSCAPPRGKESSVGRKFFISALLQPAHSLRLLWALFHPWFDDSLWHVLALRPTNETVQGASNLGGGHSCSVPPRQTFPNPCRRQVQSPLGLGVVSESVQCRYQWLTVSMLTKIRLCWRHVCGSSRTYLWSRGNSIKIWIIWRHFSVHSVLNQVHS